MSRKLFVLACLAGAGVLFAAPSSAADLASATIAAWNEYVSRTEARIAGELADRRRFLTLDVGKEGDGVRRTLLAGGLVIRRIDAGGTDVPDGTIHHWRAAVLVPGISLDRLVAALRDPQSHGYKPADVLQWRLLHRQGARERVFLQIQRREIVTAVFNTEHDVRFTVHGPGRMSSRSVATRIAEIADPGTPHAREKPVGRDRGFLWRLNSYWRYTQVGSDVRIDLESLSLSRTVPRITRPVVRPIIDRVARESLARTLNSVQRFLEAS